MGLKLAFMGTPSFSVPVLEALCAAGHEIRAVYTQPPRPGGRRGLAPTPSPVHRFAEKAGLPVFTPKSLRSDTQKKLFAQLGVQAAVVVAYGMILPKAILEIPPLGCYNAHASLLPRWRGAAPIHRAIMAGDKETGISIMRMDEGLDTGPVALMEKISIETDMTVQVLHDRLSVLAAEMMVEALERLQKGDLPLTEQSIEGVTYAEKISKQETRIDWKAGAAAVQRQVCGLSPFPGAWCEMQIGAKRERVKILACHFSPLAASERAPTALGQNCVPTEGGTPCAVQEGVVFDADRLQIVLEGGVLVPEVLQRAGGKALTRAQFLQGAPIKAIY